jgi:hypothetical protein
LSSLLQGQDSVAVRARRALGKHDEVDSVRMRESPVRD